MEFPAFPVRGAIAARTVDEGASIGAGSAPCHPRFPHGAHRGPWTAAAAILACLLAALPACGRAEAGAAPAPPPKLAACDAGFEAVLEPARARAADARAYWLDRNHLQWPGATDGGRFRLYHAARPRILARAGARAGGADGALDLAVSAQALPEALAKRYAFIGKGPVLALQPDDVARLPGLLAGQLLLVHEGDDGRMLDVTAVQSPGLLDDLYAGATEYDDFGVHVRDGRTGFRLWAPTARAVSLCMYADGAGSATAVHAMQHDARTGAWSLQLADDVTGGYYTYLVDVFVPGTGMVRNRVTDPYSASLTTDSARSWIGDLGDAALKPPGWDAARAPATVHAQTDMVIYELHVRDFSIDDASVGPAHRGKYLAFTDAGSDGMRHLRALAEAGVTDVHLLPVFDFASVPEGGCVVPAVDAGAPADSERQQAAVTEVAGRDCFNWGYDPWHYGVPEGSYATDAADGAVRVREFRAMVMALHAAGLRVGMDVVYNHVHAAGQDPRSVLDRIVPGYYQRLDADGKVETSTCCANTATEHVMMAKLMVDTAARWARDYRVDSFRFDLMGHQPRAAMEALQARVDAEAGHHVNLIGEGWNFGEVADGARFVQASQRSLGDSGIGTFSDRARDALRGGSAGDRAEALVRDQGWLNGLSYAPNAMAGDAAAARVALLHAADLVRTGLAGTLRDYVTTTSGGVRATLSSIDYGDQPAGYAAQPGEVVNYVENHDNQTLFDIDALRLPRDTPPAERARAQMLGAAVVALSQGVAYYHAGIDLLRSKSLDRNSFDSGDWFNRIDWTGSDNHFGSGLPPAPDNGKDYPLLKPVLADARIKPTPRDIAWMRDAFRDLLRIRASSTLFRLRTAADVEQRLRLLPAGLGEGAVVGAHIDGRGYPGAGFDEVLYLVNADVAAHRVSLPGERGKRYVLHPVQRAPDAVDRRPAEQARYDADTGTFEVPPRSVVVYVVGPGPRSSKSSSPRTRGSEDVDPAPTKSMDPRLRGDDDRGNDRGGGGDGQTALPAARMHAMPATEAAPAEETLLLPAPGVSDQPIKAHVHPPPGYDPRGRRRYPVLYVNDGQDWDAVGFAATLAQLHRDGAIAPAIVVAIDMPPDRMGAYGLSDRKAGRSLVGDTRYGPVGAKADAYSRWLVERLVPRIDARYRTRRDAAGRAILGWSLGALNAFNLGWQYPEVFGRVGAFSPSFWIPAERGDDTAAMRTRLAQRMVDAGDRRASSRFWFAIGDSEDEDDRDHDGINDAVDDLRDVILGYRADDGFHTRGLAELGYSVDMDADHAPRDAEVAYFLLRRGHHNQEAWKRMLPAFLAWAYPP